MSQLENLVREYAQEALYQVGDGPVNYYTFIGLFTVFLSKAKPLILAEAGPDITQGVSVAHRGSETPVQAAERIVLSHPNKKIQSIKEFRDWVRENKVDGYDGLRECKVMIEEVTLDLWQQGVLNRRPLAGYGSLDEYYLASEDRA